MVYLENRRYLASSDDLRQCSDGFPSGTTETRLPPFRRASGETAAFQEAYDNAKNKYECFIHIDVHTCKASRVQNPRRVKKCADVSAYVLERAGH